VGFAKRIRDNPMNTVFATFNDNAAGSETAPDTGSTLGLLFLALTAVFGASRFRARQST